MVPWRGQAVSWLMLVEKTRCIGLVGLMLFLFGLFWGEVTVVVDVCVVCFCCLIGFWNWPCEW